MERKMVAHLAISTHALTWSATTNGKVRGGPFDDFNSRTHVECDRFILCNWW